MLAMERMMTKQAVWVVVVYALVMVAVVVGVDLLFFRNRPWPRLTANVAIVASFGAFYFRFLRR
jgi:predicted cobalt transporter CbtA